jgi:hypothetical protein
MPLPDAIRNAMKHGILSGGFAQYIPRGGGFLVVLADGLVCERCRVLHLMFWVHREPLPGAEWEWQCLTCSANVPTEKGAET